MLYELNEWTQESWEIASLVRALSVFGVLTNTQEERRYYRQKGWSHLSSLSGLESLATSDVPKFNYASLKRISELLRREYGHGRARWTTEGPCMNKAVSCCQDGSLVANRCLEASNHTCQKEVKGKNFVLAEL